MESDSLQQCPEHEIHNLTTADSSTWLYSSADKAIITIVIPIIFALGIVNNVTFLFVIFRIPKMRSAVNIYLINLALADLLYLVLSSCHFVSQHLQSPVATYSPQFDSSAECVIFITTVNTGYFTSVAIITLVSLERYLALCHPIKHLNIRSKQRTYRYVAACWFVGFLFASSTSTDNSNPKVHCLLWPSTDAYRDLPQTVVICEAVNSWVKYYTRPLEDIPWLIALVSATFMYSSIILKMHRQKSRHSRNRTIRNRVAKMLIVNGIIFFICQTPYRVFNTTAWVCQLTKTSNPFSGLGSTIRWVSYLPQAVNTIVNPVVYGVMNPQYRAAFIQAFQCQAKRNQNDAQQVVSVSATNGNSATDKL